MIFRLLPLVAAGLFAITGFNVLGTEGCESVSFDYRGARVFSVQCFSDSSGALPADLAGFGMIAAAAVLIWIWWSLRQRPTRGAGSGFSTGLPHRTPTGHLGLSKLSPEALLLLGTPDDPQLRGVLLAMIQDYRDDPSHPATQITRRPLSAEAEHETYGLGQSVIDAIRVGGPIGAGLAHATFTATVHDVFGVDIDEALPIHQAISHAVSDAAELMVQQNLIAEARTAVHLGRRLFANAADWDTHRRTHNPIGGTA